MRKIRICILSVAHVHTSTYVRCLQNNPGAEIIGFCDESPERGQAFAHAHGLTFWPKPSEMLAQNVDVALVCSENRAHARWIALAAKAGVDVLCEKPLGINQAEMEETLDLCRSRNIRLMTAMCNRYIHSFQEAASAIRSGKIGKLIAVFASNKGTMPGGWFTDPALSGGGCIIDHTVHVADLMNHLLGALPEQVYAQAGHQLSQMEVEDSAVVTMRYPGGVVVTLDASWSRTEHFPYGRDLTLRFVGTQGSIYVDYFAENNRVYAAGERIYSYFGEDKDQMMMDDLIDCYQTGRFFPITGKDGRNCALVPQAAYRSLRSGKEVHL